VEVLGGIVTHEICRHLCPHVDHDDVVPLGDDQRGAPRRRPGPYGNLSADDPSVGDLESPISVEYNPSLLSIAMVTAPRPVSTVERSVVELRGAGFNQPLHLFAEPGSPPVGCADVVTHNNDTRKGAWRNWLDAVTTMLRESDSRFILMCEDDVEFSRCAAFGLQIAIDRFPRHDWGLASLYSPRRNLRDHFGQSGWLSVERPTLWGALAWCFTRESLQAILKSQLAADHSGDRDTDLVVSEAIRSLGRRTYFHLPSLAAHTGAGISSLGHEPLGDSAAVRFDAENRQYVSADREDPRRNQAAVRGPLNTISVRGGNSIVVVIPNYNCRTYLKRCIDSLERQTIDCGIIVVDDASTDGSLETLREYQSRVHVVTHDRNLGANQARLSGVNRTRSTWVVMADADAVYAPRFLESMLARTDSDTSVAYCAMRRRILGTGQEEVIGGRDFCAEALWWNNYISMCSLVRRSALPLDLMARSDLLEDWQLWLHLASHGHRFAAVDEVLFEALVRPEGKSALIETNAHRGAVEVANVRRPYADLIGCEEPISVVIPAKDSADLTTECLWHLARYTGLPFHVVYVDNGSCPGTVQRVEEAADILQVPLVVIRNETNRGFTRAVNQGISRSQGRHVLCLNNDCFVGPQCVERMFSELTGSAERIAAVGPLTGDDSRHSLRQPWLRDEASVNRARTFDYFDAVAGARVVRGRRRGRQDHLLAFFCTLLHRDALAACGLLDEGTFEFRSGLGADDEWCRRVFGAGWHLQMAMDAYAVHLGKSTFNRLRMDRRRLQRSALSRLRSMLAE